MCLWTVIRLCLLHCSLIICLNFRFCFFISGFLLFLLNLMSGFGLNLQPDKIFLESDKGIHLHSFRDVHWSSNPWREERALTFALVNSGEIMTAKVQVLWHCRAHHLCFGLALQTDCLMHEKDPSLCSEESCCMCLCLIWMAVMLRLHFMLLSLRFFYTHTHTHTHTHTEACGK